ncbi:NmrA family NAD(P)-binding protein [Nemorincola caseinilytica]|uniref:NmrA family NAD(P)-binding protein n=1 Tax=Nemorincola caseinilytica TaxID=2054315 RepID=A0ABP8NG35_9BACT
MRYVITGSLGHISKPLVTRLVKAAHDVTVITSSADRVKEIEALGAKAAVGRVEDTGFLTRTFTGVDAVYTMVPPKWDAQNWKEHIHSIGKNYAAAIKAAGVKKVVNLSSIGAHMPEGCGPVSGLYGVEAELNALEGTDVLHLRPAFFYYNLLANIGMIKHMGIIGGNYGENTTMALVHPADIATVAGDALLSLAHTGKSVRYIVSDERTTHDIARVLGTAIGRPGLPWVNFRDEDALNGMIQAGLSQEVAANYTEMGAAMASGKMASDYLANRPAMSPTRLEDFAKEFAAAYNS